VTRTILDCKSGKVLPWAAIQTAGYSLLDTPVEFTKEGHIYAGGLESVTGILKDEGFIDTRFYDEFSRERGEFVHKARHLDDMGMLDEESVDPEIAPYLEAWRRFRRESGFIIEQSEVPMMSKTLKYAGTPDVIGHFPSGNLKRGAVELHNDGKYKLVPFNDRQDVGLWLSILAVHNAKRNMGRGK
jgi:hypothetical protein